MNDQSWYYGYKPKRTLWRELFVSLRPFRGRDVRRILAFASLALSLPLVTGYQTGSVMDYAFAPLAVALMITQRRREQLIGRLIALLGCLVYIFHGVQSFPSYSALMYAVLLWACIGEASFLEDPR